MGYHIAYRSAPIAKATTAGALQEGWNGHTGGIRSQFRCGLSAAPPISGPTIQHFSDTKVGVVRPAGLSNSDFNFLTEVQTKSGWTATFLEHGRHVARARILLNFTVPPA